MQERPEAGTPIEVAPGLRWVLAPNASAMTHWGTNSYIVGRRRVAVVDPGPDDPRHRAALLEAIGDATVEAILITHAHRDHTALATSLAAETGAPVLGFGPPEAGRSPVMERLARSGRVGGGEGVDETFRPDETLPDGARIELGEIDIEAVHTPGHFPGHLSFAVGDALLSGDHVMGWSTTLISPPEGDVAAFLASCAKLATRGETLYLPGHGAPVRDPASLLSSLVSHRNAREDQILAALLDGPGTPQEIAGRVYDGLTPELLPAAARNVLAHLIDLTERNLAEPETEIGWDVRYYRL